MGMSMAEQEADILKRGIKKVIEDIKIEIKNPLSASIGKKGYVNKLNKVLRDAEKIYILKI